jgi:hypothetical protein
MVFVMNQLGPATNGHLPARLLRQILPGQLREGYANRPFGPPRSRFANPCERPKNMAMLRPAPTGLFPSARISLRGNSIREHHPLTLSV